MEDFNKIKIDVDKLSEKIENRIRKLEEAKKPKTEYKDKKIENTITDLDAIIKEIDKKIQELDKEEEVDINSLSDKASAKLEQLDAITSDDLDKTIYDLSDISKKINETILELEKKKKDKKRKKAMYCDMARKNKKTK